ncbi:MULTISPECIES: CPBP family intramembrane glutamic endopeptidase [Sphingobacterium]|uniref:CAAX prenyl protease 2/Lysostaphin resistance protein A-like domain-containing protein n=1 Tax=Sphingobacterium athyrii TaxID=2152717 RepID=A0A363NMX2_9SPHI|nr:MULTISPECIES: CPBP family intramembrane glutamic endopeptidase [Sphingobacterium]PUV22176.1 hypothetical protein DCO56_21640 [Sphingobacterium athyrii]QIH32280.1 CPBP family intramembrane metalloprotease [Sphingobacterium sp. DR205]
MKQKIELLIFGTLQSSIILIVFFLLFGLDIASNTITMSDQFNIFLICICSAFFEEIIFRYYLIKGLGKSFSRKKSIVISSLLFAICHLANSNFTAIAFFSHFLGGIIYAYAYMQTKYIYYPIGLHFGWNYAQWLFSLPMSGTIKEGWFNLTFPTVNYWFGGAYGIEGGLASLIVRGLLLCLVVFTVSRYDKKSINDNL